MIFFASIVLLYYAYIWRDTSNAEIVIYIKCILLYTFSLNNQIALLPLKCFCDKRDLHVLNYVTMFTLHLQKGWNKRNWQDDETRGLEQCRGDTATSVACGWAGSLKVNVTQAFGQKQWAEKAHKHWKSKMGTNQPTNRQTDIAECRVVYHAT